MITSIKNADYSFLFQEASEELVKLHFAGKLGEDALNAEELKILFPPNGEPIRDENGNYVVERFTTLEQYFTRLGTLVAHADNPIQYLMLPLDEPCLEVNANSRDIEIPAEFKKYGVSVQGDVIAETLYLRIDRFFDSMDFLETEAYIQWKLKDGTEGASVIPYIDYKSEHSAGKLILVWPLTGAITAQEGNVQFALRFLKRKGTEIVYSWNSLPCTLTIKKALNPEVSYAEYDNASGLFKMAIENSKHTSSGDEVTPPKFSAPGFDFGLDEIAYLNANNNLLLRGQAWIDDQGKLTYTWKYASLDGSVVENPIPHEAAKAAAFMLTEDTAPVANKVYYLKNNSAVPYGYEEMPHNEFNDHKGSIYERYAEYHITAGEGPSNDAPGVVTGIYELVATHKMGFDSEEASLRVKVPGPEVLEFTSGEEKDGKKTGLVENGILIADDGSLSLDVAVENDNVPAAAYQSMTYSWRKKETEDADMEAIVTNVYDNSTQGNIGKKTDAIVIENATPGWYEVAVTSMVNRDSKTIDSAITRVTNKPVAPELVFPYDDKGDNVDMVDANDVEFTNRQVVLTIEDKGYNAPIALHSDGLIYEWRIEQVAIEEGTEGFSGLGTKSLTIDGTKFSKQYMNIDCLVSNMLNGAISDESRSGIFMVSF